MSFRHIPRNPTTSIILISAFTSLQPPLPAAAQKELDRLEYFFRIPPTPQLFNAVADAYKKISDNESAAKIAARGQSAQKH